MNERPGQHAPVHYELRVEGHLDGHWSVWFGGLTLTREDDGTTTLRGAVADQAELHGLLAKVRDLGTTLLSVRATDRPGSTAGPAKTAVGTHAVVQPGSEQDHEEATHGARDDQNDDLVAV
jgi:hypothetical protein